MSNIPTNLRYTPSHEWVRKNDDGTVTIGISDYAQEQLGDLVFVETPAVGRNVDVGEACAVVESVKSASDIYSPVSGEVTATNDDLADTPELVNQDPYGEGWLFSVRSDDDLSELLDADTYSNQLASED